MTEKFKPMAVDVLNLEAKLLLGLDLLCCNRIVVPKLTIAEIVGNDLSQYNRFLTIFSITDEAITSIVEGDEEISDFDFLLYACLQKGDFATLIIDAFNFFLKTQVTCSNLGFHIGDSLLNGENFREFKWTIKKTHCLGEVSDFKPTNEKVDAYLKKVEALKDSMNIREIKNKGIEITDIISSVCSRHPNMSFSDIGNLSMYQLVDVFKRLHKLDDYFINIEALVHGASKDNTDIRHYTEKLI